MNWLPDIFRRKTLYGDLAEEMRLHLEEKTEQFMAEGMSRKEAEQAARRAFGNATVLEERSREVWQLPLVESLGTDLKLVLRRLRKSPGFAATVILTLAIGIGANTAVFSVVNSILFKPLPYPNAEQLVAVRLIAPGAAGLADFSSGLRLSSSMYFTFAEQNRTFQSFGVWTTGTANVTGVDQPHEVHTASVSDGVLQALSVPPVLGRWLLPADQDPHGAKPVMLSYGYWQRRFGGDRSVIGRSIAIDAQPRQIVGVMPKGFELVNAEFDVITPFAFDRNKQQLAGFGLQGIARLKPGIPIAQANADVKRMLPIWEDSWPSGIADFDSHFYERRLENRARYSSPQTGSHWQCWQCAVGGDGYHWRGDADCLHQCGEPVAGESGWPAAGACRPGCAGRLARTNRVGTAAGKCGPRTHRRGAGNRDRL